MSSKKVSKKENTTKQTQKPNKKQLYFILTILVTLIIIGAGIYSSLQNSKTIEHINQTQDTPKVSDISTAAINSKLQYQINDDIILGNKNASVTIIEYASLSCSHCANFYNNVFPQLDNQYIKTGKVKFIYRDFPLNKSALLATAVATCHLRNNDYNSNKYYKFLKVLFKTQDSWAFSGNFLEKLRSLAKLDGMTSDQFESCVKNQVLIEEILEKRTRASSELQIRSTPTFIINGKKIDGYRHFDDFKKVIEAELQ